MDDVVTGAAEVLTDRPLVFKSVGMSWQDVLLPRLIENQQSGVAALT